MILLQTFFVLMFCHALADYPLQGDFLSRAKNRTAPIPGIDWRIVLASHCMIHAGFVYLVTGQLLMAATQFVSHWAIDDLKCQGRITFVQDQALHLLVMLAIALVYVYAR